MCCEPSLGPALLRSKLAAFAILSVCLHFFWSYLALRFLPAVMEPKVLLYVIVCSAGCSYWVGLWLRFVLVPFAWNWALFQKSKTYQSRNFKPISGALHWLNPRGMEDTCWQALWFSGAGPELCIFCRPSASAYAITRANLHSSVSNIFQHFLNIASHGLSSVLDQEWYAISLTRAAYQRVFAGWCQKDEFWHAIGYTCLCVLCRWSLPLLRVFLLHPTISRSGGRDCIAYLIWLYLYVFVFFVCEGL